MGEWLKPAVFRRAEPGQERTMIRYAKDLSPDQKAVIESILGRHVLEEEAISVRAMSAVPEWLQKAWKGAHERGLDRLTPDDIQAEIDAYRREKLQDTREEQR
jgi:hypothetical protein